MSSLGAITLLRPGWLIALLAIGIAALLLQRQKTGLGNWDKVVDPDLMDAMRVLGRVEGHRTGVAGLAGLLAATIVVLALSGPAVERRAALAFRNVDGVVFVLDVSESVTKGPDWLALQTMGRFGVAALGSRPAGLIVFAGDAYVAVDMTADTDQLGATLLTIDAKTVPDPGSRPQLGLALALEMLESADILAGDVVLMSDGAGIGPDAIGLASRIAEERARLSVVAPRIDAATEKLVAAGAGQAFDLSQIDGFAAFLSRSGRERLEQQDYELLFRADLGRYLLILALLPALKAFRRRQV